MRAAHTCVHHKDRGLNRGAFTGLEYHRTDGQAGRSTPLAHFDVGLFSETERAVAGVRHFNCKCQVCF